MNPGTARLRLAIVTGLAPVLGLASLASGGTGCVANGGDESMIVLKNVRPGDNCMFKPSETENGISRGALDIQVHTGYLFTAQVKSRVTAVAGQEDQRTILISGANVDISFPGSTLFTAAELDDLKAQALTHFKTLFSSPLPPNGSLLDTQFELIPRELAEAVSAKAGTASAVALATFRIVGAFPGADSEQTSQAFQYPIEIVNGGLVADHGACADLSSTFVPKVGNSCNPGQDFQVDCCHDDTGLQCPAVGTKM